MAGVGTLQSLVLQEIVSVSTHVFPFWQTSRPPESPWSKERGEVCMGSGGTTGKCREQDRGPALTWHKEAPAQIMELVMHEPQYCWHHLTVTRGRTSHRRCARVTLPVGRVGVVRPQMAYPYPCLPPRFLTQVPTYTTEAPSRPCEAFRQCLI